MQSNQANQPASGQTKKAFQLQYGQFVCHLYASLEDDDKFVIQDFIEAIETSQSDSCVNPWKANYDSDKDDSLRLTLLRGHRAIHHHQIKPLLSALKAECDTIEPVNVCLNDLRIFDNHEKTREFLCMVSLGNNQNFDNLKRNLRIIVDRFATKLTPEDETEDTCAHCSMLSREINREHDDESDTKASLSKISEIVESKFGELPICLVKINKIYMRIGHQNYCINLKNL